MSTIYLDMDGVIADFCRSSLAAHGRLDILDNYKIGEWDIGSLMGISEADFWKPVDALGVDFWADLPEYPWTRELIQFCKAFCDDLVVLTDPSGRPAAMHGKKIWLDRVFGERQYKVVYGKEKWRLSAPGDLLIDDNLGHLNAFAKRPDGNASGVSVLFPQDWNIGKHPDPLTVVIPKIHEGLGTVMHAAPG